MTDNNLTSILDNKEAIKAIDPSGALTSAESLADQIQQVWDEREQIKFPEQHPEIKQVVVAGMGGSALGADFVKALFKSKLKVPLIINNDYSLPAFVDQHSLVILSSYSGNTEEVLACAKEAQTKQAQIAVISAGGQLTKLAQNNNYPRFIIEAKHNPSGQPRMAVGYSIMAFISLLKAAQLLDFNEQQLAEVIAVVNKTSEACALDLPQEDNKAKLLAYLSLERRPILVGAEFLSGALHVATNQFNENAKIFADYKLLPELNHHLLEGLAFPKSNPLNHFFIFFQSGLYNERNQKRLELTRQLLNKKELENIVVELSSESQLTQAFELITLATFANLYLAFLEQIDPCPIPSVDWFKEQLAK